MSLQMFNLHYIKRKWIGQQLIDAVDIEPFYISITFYTLSQSELSKNLGQLSQCVCLISAKIVVNEMWREGQLNIKTIADLKS